MHQQAYAGVLPVLALQCVTDRYRSVPNFCV